MPKSILFFFSGSFFHLLDFEIRHEKSENAEDADDTFSEWTKMVSVCAYNTSFGAANIEPPTHALHMDLKQKK